LLAQLTITKIAAIAGILLISGLIKGTMGVGLPLIAVPLISQIESVPIAITMLATASVLSNGYQAIRNGEILPVARRFWPLFIPLVTALFAGARLLVSLDEKMLGLILGASLLVFAVVTPFQRRFEIGARHERVLSPLVGLVAGFLGGVSSFYGPPLIMYIVALRLPRDFFVSAVSAALLLGGLPLLVSLFVYGIMGRDEFILSCLGVIPVFAGLLIGQRVQRRIPQETFRKWLFVILGLIGVSTILHALFL